MKSMWIIILGLLLIVAGTAMPLLHAQGETYKYIYAAGALVLIIGRLSLPSPDKKLSLRLRRMMRLETWSAIIFVFATVIMFMPSHLVGTRDWIAFTIAGGVLQAYTSIMIPHLQRKEAENTNTDDK